MISLIKRLLGRRRQLPCVPPSGLRINVPRSVMRALRSATVPRRGVEEPLAFLRARYASEDATDVLVGIGVIPFAHEAYVAGDAGATFDTRWTVDIANDEIRSNIGLLLVHSHGGQGQPAFSPIDRTTNAEVMLPFSFGISSAPYGALVLSDDDAFAVVAVGHRLVAARVVPVADWNSQGNDRA
jgi:hypothetical protein